MAAAVDGDRLSILAKWVTRRSPSGDDHDTPQLQLAGVPVKRGSYGFGGAVGAATDVELPAGKTPVLESGARDAVGEAWTGVIPGERPGEL